jgi:hypothetical protein
MREHGLWDALKQTRKLLSDIQLPHDQNEVGKRIRAVDAYVQGFRGASPAMFSLVMMQNAYSLWQGVHGHLINYSNNPDIGYLDQVNQYLDQVLAAVSAWPRPLGTAGHEVAVSATFDALLEQMRAQEVAHRAAAEELNDDLKALHQQRELLEQKLAQVEAQVAAQVPAIEKATTAQNETFNKAQTDRAEAYTTWLAERREEQKKSEVASEKSIEAYASAAEALLNTMSETQDKTEKVAGDTTSAVLARSFGTYSQREYWSALGAFAVGILLTLVAAAILFTAMTSLSADQPATWQWVVLKLGVTATLVGGASVAIALGNRFWKNSAANKRVELELRAIGPFLMDLGDEEAAKEAKLTFVSRTFGRAWEQPAGKNDHDDDEVNVNALAKLAQTVVDAVGAISKVR